MPRLSVWFVRCSFIHLFWGFTFGGFILVNKGFPFAPWVWNLLSAHMESLLLGWMVQLAMGVGYWILPRFRSDLPRGNINIVWGALVLLNTGIAMVAIQPFISTTKNVSLIYWGMTLGAFGLVLGPWLGGSLPPAVSGLVLHLSSTIWLIVLTIQAFKASGKLNSPGAWHLVSSYIWITAPIMMAPFILLGVFEAGPHRINCASSLNLWLGFAIWHCPHPIHCAAILPQGRESTTRW